MKDLTKNHLDAIVTLLIPSLVSKLEGHCVYAGWRFSKARNNKPMPVVDDTANAVHSTLLWKWRLDEVS